MARNKGYSLVEVLAVIAIMAVLIGAGVTMTGAIPRFRLSACRKNIISQLENTRTDALSFKEAYLILYRDGDGIYVETKSSRKDAQAVIEKVGEKSIEVYYVFGEGGTPVLLEVGDRLKLSFDRSSGAFRKPELNGSVKAYCTGLYLRLGSREYRISLTPVTGKISAQ